MRTTFWGLLMTSALIAGSATAQANVPVLTGGVGASDRAMIESQQRNYSTKLVFTGKGGMYVSDVQVNIVDKAGNPVLSTVTDGPILLTNLPAGNYKATVVAQGIEKTIPISSKGGLRTYQVTFPITDNPELSNADGTYLPKAPSSMDVYRPIGE